MMFAFQRYRQVSISNRALRAELPPPARTWWTDRTCRKNETARVIDVAARELQTTAAVTINLRRLIISTNAQARCWHEPIEPDDSAEAVFPVNNKENQPLSSRRHGHDATVPQGTPLRGVR